MQQVVNPSMPNVPQEEEFEEQYDLSYRDPNFLKSGVDVTYCPKCSLPPEFCEYNTKKVFNQCKPYLIKNHPDLYPQLVKEAQQAAQQKRRPTLKPHFYNWCEIPQLHTVKSHCLATPSSSSVIAYRGKIKLHGTNAAITIQTLRPTLGGGGGRQNNKRYNKNNKNNKNNNKNNQNNNKNTHNTQNDVSATQANSPNKEPSIPTPTAPEVNELFIQSRNTFLTLDKDHHGFAEWSTKTKSFFITVYESFLNTYSTSDLKISAVTFFGEWCGEGIMKGAAICGIPKKIFAVFSVLVNSSFLIYEPAQIQSILSLPSIPIPDDVVVIPWVTDTLILDLSESSPDLIEKIDYINQLVRKVDKEDPWVKEKFNISGSGEGIVWYPIPKEMSTMGNSLTGIQENEFNKQVFKTKGVTHSVSVGPPASAESLVVTNVDEFLAMFVTVPRLNQGWEEVCGTKADMEKLKAFVKWVEEDVKKESAGERTKSALEWESVVHGVRLEARKYFYEAIRQFVGTDVPKEN